MGNPLRAERGREGRVETLDIGAGSGTGTELFKATVGLGVCVVQASGDFVGAIDASTFLVARFSSSSGALDKTFGDDGTKSVAAGGQASSASVVVAQPDDSIVVLGTATLAAGATDIAFARLTKSPVPSWTTRSGTSGGTDDAVRAWERGRV